MDQIRDAARPALPNEPLETPRSRTNAADLTRYFERLNQQDGIELPYKEWGSPSKRRKSPGHDAAKYIGILFFKDRPALDHLLGEYRVQSPTLYGNDDKLNHLLEMLTVAVKSPQKNGTPRSQRQVQAAPSPTGRDPLQITSMGPPANAQASRIRETPSSSRWPPPSLQSTPFVELPAPPSPTLSIRHGPKPPLDDIAKYPQLPPAMAAAPKAAAAAGITSVNTSFATTANTSFWSEPAVSQEPASPATSVDSFSFMDGADDMSDYKTTQLGILPVSSMLGSEYSEIMEATRHPQTGGSNTSSTESKRSWRSAQETQEPTSPITAISSKPSAPEPKMLFQEVPTQSYYRTSSAFELPHSEPTTPNRNRASKQVHQGGTNGDLSNEPPQPLTEPRTPHREMSGDGGRPMDEAAKESPSKQSGEHVRVHAIPQHGISGSLELSTALHDLPFPLLFEFVRVMQACSLTSEDIQQHWRAPRKFENLRKVAQKLAPPSFQSNLEAAYEACSYHMNLRWTGSKDKSKGKALFEPELLPPGQDQLNSWQRKYGCDRFLFVDVDPLEKPPKHLDLSNQKDHIRQRFLEMLGTPVKFLGRTWLQFHAQQKKSNKKSFNPDDARAGVMQYIFVALSSDDGLLPPLDLRDIVGWAIPFASNLEELWCKIFARLDLRASRTVEVIELRPEDVEFLRDARATRDAPDAQFNDPRFSSQFDQNERYIEKTVMNDGCSLAHPYLFRWIEQKFGCKFPISVAQFRLAGAKGVFSRKQIDRSKPSDLDLRPEGPLIDIHDSQLKLKPGKNMLKEHYDEHYWRLYIVKTSHPSQSSVLHMDFLPILIDRHVPSQVIEEIALQTAKVETEEFLQAVHDPRKLREWIHRENASLEDQRREQDINTLAGFPKARMERAIQMLESGFEATKFKPLAKEIQKAASAAFKRKKQFFRIPLQHSVNVFGIADPTNTLEPGEIYYASSSLMIDPIDGTPCFCLKGEVLAARSPSARPSDIQKVRAVQRTELSHLFDVVVFSSKGPRPLADKLSGGDYDGDIFWLCWDPRLVAPFMNVPAPQGLPHPTVFGIKVDDRKLKTIVQDPTDEEQVRLFVRMGTANRLNFNLLGMVTKTLARVTHLEGLHTPRATALMDLKDLIMDSDKNGRIFDFDAWNNFKKEHGLVNLPNPAHFEYTNPVDQSEDVKYKPKDSNNIIDKIYFDVLGQTFDQALSVAEERLGQASPDDTDLTTLYRQMCQEAEMNVIVDSELAKLKENLYSLQKTWGERVGYWKTITKQHEKTIAWDASVLACRKIFEDIKPVNPSYHPIIKEWTRRSAYELSIWDRLKASAMAALLTDNQKKMWFHLAAGELCYIKASSFPEYRLLPLSLYKMLGFRKPPKRKVKAVDDAEGEDGDMDVVDAAEDQDAVMEN